ncbi:MAG: DUF2809 domain-containing protein [Clostridia bacterium]|nr:DUF2809 domain-containing protein [Clostridia bacterium]
MKPNVRKTYAVLFAALLLIEICIALFVRDRFVRPYVGDMLVTLLIGCFIRIFAPQKPLLLPIYVFLFAAVVEVSQYFDLIALLGLGDNRFLSLIIGRTFSAADLLCYAAGCLALFGADVLMRHRNRSKT